MKVLKSHTHTQGQHILIPLSAGRACILRRVRERDETRHILYWIKLNARARGSTTYILVALGKTRVPSESCRGLMLMLCGESQPAPDVYKGIYKIRTTIYYFVM